MGPYFVFSRAIHWPVSKYHNPWGALSIQYGLSQVLFQPMVLSDHGVNPEIEIVVDLCADADKVNRTCVKAVIHVAKLALGHGETVFVVAEIAVRPDGIRDHFNRKSFSCKE